MTTFFNISTLTVALLTGVLYWVGLEESLFWYFWWYDIVMHLLGGLTVGLWVSALASRRLVAPARALMLTIVAALVVGVVWEVFEVVADLTQPDGYWVDTIADLVNDTCGAVVGTLLYTILYRRSQNTNV